MNFYFYALMIAMSMAASTQTMQKTKESAARQLAENIAIGSAAGIAEVTIDQPLMYFKNMIQQGKPIYDNSQSWYHNLRVWYRGYAVNAGSMAPITAIQVAATQAIQEQIAPAGEASSTQRIGAATAGGMISALVSSPSELVILHKQNDGGSTMQTIRAIVAHKNHLNIMRGVMPTAGRDGGFTAGYMGLAPVIKEQLKGKVDHPVAAAACAGVGAGVPVAIVTHPWDLIKAKLQENIHGAKRKSMVETAHAVYQQEGWQAFFKGFTPRATRVISAITVMSTVENELRKQINKRKQ